TWIVNVGRRVDGKADLRRFQTEEDAKVFASQWNLKLFENRTPDLADLQDVARHEVLSALGKLKIVGANLADAVDFYLEFGRPAKGHLVLKDAVAAFLLEKERQRVSSKYQYSIERTTLRPFMKFVGERSTMGSITRELVHSFLKSKPHWS